MKRLIKHALLMFGCFAVGYNAANLLHELGHGFAAWLGGGGLSRITLNPFYWNYSYTYECTNQLLRVWGGAAFGSAFAVAISAGCMRLRSRYCAPCYGIAACALAVNGIYLFVGALMKSGDASALLKLGMPPVLLYGLGLGLMLGAAVWLSAIQPLLGISEGTSFRRRLLLLGLGTSAYLLLILIYNLVMNSRDLLLWVVFVAFGLLAVAGVTVLAHFTDMRLRRLLRLRELEPSWGSAIAALSAGLVIIAAELLVF